MIGIKNLFASKTVLTAILGAIFTLLNGFGVIAVSPETQATIITALFGLAGFFRFTATKQLAVTTG
jgi:uncharacterized membrane protein